MIFGQVETEIELINSNSITSAIILSAEAIASQIFKKQQLKCENIVDNIF